MKRYLKHYGVKGMKWRVRKDSYYTPKGSKSGKGSKKEKRNLNGLFDKLFKKKVKELIVSPYLKLSNINSIDEVPKKDKDYTDDEDRSLVNPEFDENIPETYLNCAHCSIAYDMRRHGYDVKAIQTTEGISIDDFQLRYNNAQVKKTEIWGHEETRDTILTKEELQKWHDSRDRDDTRTSDKIVMDAVEREILSYGEGSYGIFTNMWDNIGHSGHAVNFSVENNKVYLSDSQTNEKKLLHDYLSRYDEFITPNTDSNNRSYNNFTKIDSITFFRTDNLEFNENVLPSIRRR